MPVGDILEFALCCYDSVQNSINVFHQRIQSVTGTEPTIPQVAASQSSLWGLQLRTVFNSTITYKGMKVRRVSPNPTGVIIDTTGTGVGALAGHALPGQLSAVISLRSSFAPPGVRGRSYVPSADEASNSATGSLEAAYTALVVTYAAFFTMTHTVTVGVNNLVLAPCIYRRTAGTFYVIDQALVRPQWGTQRRRSRINRGDTSAI